MHLTNIQRLRALTCIASSEFLCGRGRFSYPPLWLAGERSEPALCIFGHWCLGLGHSFTIGIWALVIPPGGVVHNRPEPAHLLPQSLPNHLLPQYLPHPTPLRREPAHLLLIHNRPLPKLCCRQSQWRPRRTVLPDGVAGTSPLAWDSPVEGASARNIGVAGSAWTIIKSGMSRGVRVAEVSVLFWGWSMSSQAERVGEKLVDLCSHGKNMEAVEMLYRPDVVSTEAADM